MKPIFTRDNLIWGFAFFASVLMFVVSHTMLIPDAYAHTAQDIAAVAAFISGKLGWSYLPASGDQR